MGKEVYFMSIYSEIGNRIVFLRKQMGYTQERFALEANVSVTYLRSIERGEANPTIRELGLITTALGVKLENPIGSPSSNPDEDKEEK